MRSPTQCPPPPKAVCALLEVMVLLADVRAGPASLPGEATPLKAVAAAAAASNGGRGGSRRYRAPSHLATVTPDISGKPCVYTPALLPEYTDATTYKNAAPLTSCIDTRLTAAQKTACLTCLAIRDERRCLAQVGCAAWNLLQIEVQHGLLPCAHEALPGMPMGS